MRIISGKYKGKKIFHPLDNFTRPLKDITKESIFNIIEHSNILNLDINSSHVLDLFSGVGSFGVECLSRGALSTTFFENYSKVLPILKKNISLLNLEKRTNILEKDIFESNSLSNLNKKFEIIFLDPPYKEKRLIQLLDTIINLNLLNENGVFIIHRHKKEIDNFPKKFKILKEKTHGISKIIFGR